MTREIKFRAWHKKIGEMANVETIFMNGYAHLAPISKISTDSKMFRFDEFEMMQFTGLKDKNGKEIYEGDIIKYQDGVNTIGFEDGSFVRYFIESGSTNINQKDMLEIEVIGNIYQNPELLTK